MEPHIYTIVEKEQLHDMLNSFSFCFNLPVHLTDANGNILQSYGKVTSFCSLFKKNLPPEDSCTHLHMRAARHAVSLGETYIFSCHANLNHIVFPLIKNTALLGSILIGPFLMEAPDALLISDIHKHYPSMDTDFLLELYEEMDSVAGAGHADQQASLLPAFKSDFRQPSAADHQSAEAAPTVQNQ